MKHRDPWLAVAAVAQFGAALLSLLQGDLTDGLQWFCIGALTMHAASL